MKRILEELKGARKIEWFLIVFAIAALLLTQLGDSALSSAHLSQQEKRLCEILKKIEGAGSVEVMISDNPLAGVLVVSEGADDLRVCLRLQYAVQTLLGTEASRIEILPYQK